MSNNRLRQPSGHPTRLSSGPSISPKTRMGLSAWVLAGCLMALAACSDDPAPTVDRPCGAEFIDGKPCDANPNPGKGDHCRTFGKERCEEEAIVCVPNEPVPPFGRELAGNGIDDDCDGDTDENNPDDLGEDCKIGVGACEQTGVKVLDIQGDGEYSTKCVLKPGTEPIEPAESDPCNGIDDDCDGETDEDEAERPCGECGEGVQACVDGQFGGCEGEDTENELDADCDNGQLGACKREGKIDCDVDEDGNPVKACKDEEGELVGAVEPAPAELCTLGDEEPEDEDCDGETDEGFEAKGDPCEEGQGACRVEGNLGCAEDRLSLACKDGEGELVVAGEPAPAELCTPGGEMPIDDDCDGDTDEGFETQGDPCARGEGACRDTGNIVCDRNSDRTALVCNAEEGEPVPEICGNGEDDDCDREIDEMFNGEEIPENRVNPGDPCLVGVGACETEGQLFCPEGGAPQLACNAEAGEPGENELCGNGIDDDCNGDTDEGFEALGDPCEVGEGACRAEGNEICSEDLLALVCDAEEGEPVPEICGNGEDDDCDTEIDELEFEGEIVEQGEPCFGGFVINSIDCSVPGNYACSEGLVICDKDVAAEGLLIAQKPICDANCNNLVDRFPFVPLSEGSTRMISEGEISIQNAGVVRACVDLDARPTVNRTRTDFRSFIEVTAGARGFLPSIADLDGVCDTYEPNPDAVDNYGVEILPASDFPNSFYVALFNPDFMIFGFSGNAASMTEDGDYYGTDINGNDAQDTCGRVRNGNNGARNSTVGAHMGVETGEIEE